MEPAKLLLPYLQRADELQKHQPLVAYYCRLYAMERGLKIPVKERTKTTNALLVSLMSQLEKDKKSIVLGPEDNLYVEGFALNVFTKADKQDRAGRADLNTAKTFYAASIFFEILHQFGEMQPDIEQKQKYAVWKAADIRKALSEGRKPQPGPPGGDEEFTFASEMQDAENFSGVSNVATSEVEPPAEQPANAVRLPKSGVDIPSSAAPTWQHYSADADLPVTSPHPLRPVDSSTSGYPATYSDSSYTSVPVGSGVPPSTGVSYQYGSRTSLERSDGQPFSQSHLLYSSPSHNGQMGSHPLPPTYSAPPADNAASGVSYFQNTQYPDAPPYSVNTAPTHSSSQHGLYPSGQNIVGYNDSTSLERTTSAPAYGQSSGFSVKGTENSSYQPPPEKIAEAHKASRFAVSALAFDDVPTAVSFLKRSLELLTNPSASVH